jgi:hypothetical protein
VLCPNTKAPQNSSITSLIRSPPVSWNRTSIRPGRLLTKPGDSTFWPLALSDYGDFLANYFVSGRRMVSKNEPSTNWRRDSSNRTHATGTLPTEVFGNGSIDFQSLTTDRFPIPETRKTS